MRRTRRRNQVERYELGRSPFALSPTQRDTALLVKETRDDLVKLGTPRFRDQFIVKRTISCGAKKRDLVYPVGRLRA